MLSLPPQRAMLGTSAVPWMSQDGCLRRVAQAPPSGQLAHIALPRVALLVWAGWDRTVRSPAVGASTHSLNSHHNSVGALLMITLFEAR